MSLLIQSCFGWSEAGHRIIASIAFRELSEKQKIAFVTWLESHPRYSDDFEHPLAKEKAELSEQERQEWMIQQASLWPDLARNFKGKLRSEYHHGPWHYINSPIFLSPQDERSMNASLKSNLDMKAHVPLQANMNVVQAIRTSRLVLKDRLSSPRDKAIMLSWLCHAVGDVHQPLHATTLFSVDGFKEGDRGGNEINTKQHGNLHSLWDTFPGGDISWRTARVRALKLIEEHRGFASKPVDLNEEIWLNESISLAKELVYTPEVRRKANDSSGKAGIPIQLSEEYLAAGGKAAKERLVQAGIRLGAILKDVLPNE